MKKLFIAIALCCTALLFAQEKIGDKVYKEVTVGGKKLGKWVVLVEKKNFDPKYIITETAGSKTINEYDDKGRNIHAQYYLMDSEYNSETNDYEDVLSLSGEIWLEYDAKGNKVYEKEWESNDEEFIETRYEYDSKGNMIYEENSLGIEFWYDYDAKGNLVHAKSNNDFEEWYEYNAKGKNIHHKTNSGYETWSSYDAKGNCVNQKSVSPGVDGQSEWWAEYNNKGNMIHYRHSNGLLEYWLEYDAKGGLVYKKYQDGLEEFYVNEYVSNKLKSSSKYCKEDDVYLF